ELGVIALSCAAADDVTAWCLLAFVVGVVQTQMGGALLVVILSALYIAFMFFVVQPVIARLLPYLESKRLDQGAVAVVLVALLLSSLATELIGVHGIFGAFLLGAVIPHDSAIARTLPHKLEDLVIVLLLPAFFAFTGMRTQIGLVSSLEQWLVPGLTLPGPTPANFAGRRTAARVA